MEVYDTGKVHPKGKKFLAFRDVSLVPFEPKLIDPVLLSPKEKRWLNEYNARIREFVGLELKQQLNVQAFHWMMNKTLHMIEYLPEEVYRGSAGETGGDRRFLCGLVMGLIVALRAIGGQLVA